MEYCWKSSAKGCWRVLGLAVLLALAAQVEQPCLAFNKVSRNGRRAESREIQQLDEQWRAALIAGDTGTLDRMLSEDFLGIGSNGTLSTKQEYIRRIGTHEQQFQRLDILESKVRLQPSSAVVIAQARVQGHTGNEALDGVFRYTVVYGRKAGGPWKILNFEATRVSGKDEPTAQAGAVPESVHPQK